MAAVPPQTLLGELLMFHQTESSPDTGSSWIQGVQLLRKGKGK